MKIYRIRVGNYMYVKFVTVGGEPFVQCVITGNKKSAAWYEEDKAKFYCDELNKASKHEDLFKLEEVGGADYGKA